MWYFENIFGRKKEPELTKIEQVALADIAFENPPSPVGAPVMPIELNDINADIERALSQSG